MRKWRYLAAALGLETVAVMCNALGFGFVVFACGMLCGVMICDFVRAFDGEKDHIT